ncbi:MAG: hypothetical protein MI861_21200 [Pirellulales bacterium]|nr:hypothetical protein [Pirellulales bacterium]
MSISLANQASRRLGSLATLLLAALWTCTTVRAETWTNLSGTRSIEARMIGMWNGNVILEIDGARRVAVALEDLRAESRIQAQQLQKRIEQAAKARIAELSGQASAAAAPAPNPIPRPTPAEAYLKPQPDQSAAEFLQHLRDQLSNGHVVVIYDALPPSYRNDIDEVVQLWMSKVDPVAWNSLASSLFQLGDLVVTRQNWFFSTPRMDAMPAEDYDAFRAQLLAACGALRDGCHPRAMQLGRLQNMKFGAWLAQFDQAVSPHLKTLFDYQEIGRFSVASETAEGAIVKVMRSGRPSDLRLKKVEGYWVPESLAAGWADQMAKRKLRLQQTANGSALANLPELAAVQVILAALASANDQGQFHLALETILPDVSNMAIASGIALASNTRNSRNGRNGYGDGYGDQGYGEEGYAEMDEEMMQMEMEANSEYESQMSQEEMRLRRQGR